MRYNCSIARALGYVALLSMGATSNAAGASFSGTWVLDLARSDFPPGFDEPKSLTWKIEQTGDDIKWHYDLTKKDGSSTSEDFDNNGDTRLHPVRGKYPNAVGWTRVQGDTLLFNYSNPDIYSLSFVSKCTLSGDGKTLGCMGQRTSPDADSGGFHVKTEKLVYGLSP